MSGLYQRICELTPQKRGLLKFIMVTPLSMNESLQCKISKEDIFSEAENVSPTLVFCLNKTLLSSFLGQLLSAVQGT